MSVEVHSKLWHILWTSASLVIKAGQDGRRGYTHPGQDKRRWKAKSECRLRPSPNHTTVVESVKKHAADVSGGRSQCAWLQSKPKTKQDILEFRLQSSWDCSQLPILPPSSTPLYSCNFAPHRCHHGETMNTKDALERIERY